MSISYKYYEFFFWNVENVEFTVITFSDLIGNRTNYEHLSLKANVIVIRPSLLAHSNLFQYLLNFVVIAIFLITCISLYEI